MEEKLYQLAITISTPSAQAYRFEPQPDLIFSFGGKVPLRNIFSHQQFSEFEVEKLSRLKNEVEKSRLSLPSDWDDAFLMRIIHGSGYKTRKAFKDLKNSIEAFKALIPSDPKLLYSKCLKVLNEGFLYVFGRDKYFRPAIIMDVTKVNVKKFTVDEYVEATVFLTEFVIKYMLIPGKVEGWVNIVEMGHWGLRELPLKSLMKISSSLQHVYKCRLANSFIINPPSSIYYIWGLFRPFVDKVTQTKIIIIKEGVSKQMLDLYEPEQLEKKFGGISENLSTFWPPVIPKLSGESDSIDQIKIEKKSLKNDEIVKVKTNKREKKDNNKKIKEKNKEKGNYLEENNIENNFQLKKEGSDFSKENNEEVFLDIVKKLEVLKEIEEEIEEGQGEVVEDVVNEINIDKKERKRIREERKEMRRIRKENKQKSLSEEGMREELEIKSSFTEQPKEENSIKIPEIEAESHGYLCGCQSGCLIS